MIPRSTDTTKFYGETLWLIAKMFPSLAVLQAAAFFFRSAQRRFIITDSFRLPAGVSLFARRRSWPLPAFFVLPDKPPPRFLRSAHRFFIISDSRFLPAGVSRWVRFALGIPSTEVVEAPSSAAIALFNL